jgi:hypothetical protein
MFSQLFKESTLDVKGHVGGGRGPKAVYLRNCTSFTSEDIHLLSDMVENSHQITYSTFTSNTVWKPVAADLGYSVTTEFGMRLSQDLCVTYYKSTFDGKVCYYMKHSAIEYIFIRG